MCAVVLEYQGAIFLIVCVYMPSDSNRPNHNIVEYHLILNDIKIIANSVNVDHIIVYKIIVT